MTKDYKTIEVARRILRAFHTVFPLDVLRDAGANRARVSLLDLGEVVFVGSPKGDVVDKLGFWASKAGVVIPPSIVVKDEVGLGGVVRGPLTFDPHAPPMLLEKNIPGAGFTIVARMKGAPGQASSGTAGWSFEWVDGQTRTRRFLSNWHVLALGQNLTPSKVNKMVVSIGVQPIGKLVRYEPVQPCAINLWDLAIGKYNSLVSPEARFRDYAASTPPLPPYPTAIAPWTAGTKLTLVGGAGVAVGFAEDLVTVPGDYFGGVAFQEQLRVRPSMGYTQGGDSGGVWVDDAGNAIALNHSRDKFADPEGDLCAYASPLDLLGWTAVSSNSALPAFTKI